VGLGSFTQLKLGVNAERTEHPLTRCFHPLRAFGHNASDSKDAMGHNDGRNDWRQYNKQTFTTISGADGGLGTRWQHSIAPASEHRR
jgi:hypothetical protein